MSNNTQNTDLVEAKIRLTNAQAEARELKNAIMRGEYAPIESVNQKWNEDAGRVKTQLLALGTRLAPSLLNMHATIDIKNTIDSAVYEILNELADYYSNPEESQE